MKGILIFMLSVVTTVQAFSQKVGIKKRFVNHTEVGVLSGRVKYDYGNSTSQVDSKHSITAQTFNGVRLTNRLSAGVIVGVDWYKAAMVTPLAAGVRYDLTKGDVERLFAVMDAGYGATWLHQDVDNTTTRGGLMLNPGIGIKYGKPGHVAFTITVSYKRQEIKVNKPLFWEQTYRLEERIYNRLALKIGMTF